MANFKITKGKLLSIRELKIPEIVLVDETRFFQYTHGPLLTFFERFPKYEEQIKSVLETRDFRLLSQHLQEVCDKLETIYAVDLALDCRKKMAKLSDAKPEVVEAYVTYFLTAVSMLSIDLQMAVFSSRDGKEDGDIAIVADKGKNSRSILAVDDVPFFLKTLERALENSRYELAAVTSGQVALRYLQNHQPNLFILDIEMPGMDGYELAKKIRESGQKAPILFLTGNAQQEYVFRAIEAGAADFVLKPINREYLLARIEKHIE